MAKNKFSKVRRIVSMDRNTTAFKRQWNLIKDNLKGALKVSATRVLDDINLKEQAVDLLTSLIADPGDNDGLVKYKVLKRLYTLPERKDLFAGLFMENKFDNTFLNNAGGMVSDEIRGTVINSIKQSLREMDPMLIGSDAKFQQACLTLVSVGQGEWLRGYVERRIIHEWHREGLKLSRIAWTALGLNPPALVKVPKPQYQEIIREAPRYRRSVRSAYYEKSISTLRQAGLIAANASLIALARGEARYFMNYVIGEFPETGFDNETASAIEERTKTLIVAWEKLDSAEKKASFLDQGPGNDPCIAGRLDSFQLYAQPILLGEEIVPGGEKNDNFTAPMYDAMASWFSEEGIMTEEEANARISDLLAAMEEEFSEFKKAEPQNFDPTFSYALEAALAVIDF